MQTLQPQQCERVRPLFAGPHLELVVEAVIAGNTPGLLWADDAAQPRAAFLWDRAHGCYLGGAADDPAFLRGLRDMIAEWLLPEATARRLGRLKVVPGSEEWQPQVGVLFGAAAPMRRDRLFFTLAPGDAVTPPPALPGGFRLAPIDRELLANAGLENGAELRAEIAGCWTSPQAFLEKGYGVCVLHGDAIACWCTAEFAAGNRYGIGIETVAAYQNRGLATCAATAFTERCLAAGFMLYWDAWKTNLPSLAVAAKVGFRSPLEYPAYFIPLAEPS